MELSPSMVVEVASNSAAGFGLRLAARLIDLLFGGLAVFLGGSLGAMALHALALRGLVHGGAPAVQLVSVAVISWSLLGGLLASITAEAVGGATLGKLALRLRVTSEDLTPSTFKGALLRNLALCADALILPAYRAMSRSLMNQRLGDQWGHTVVLHAHSVPPDSRRGVGRLLLGALGGCGLWVLWISLFVLARGA